MQALKRSWANQLSPVPSLPAQHAFLENHKPWRPSVPPPGFGARFSLRTGMKTLPRELLFPPEGNWRPEPSGNFLCLSLCVCVSLFLHGTLARTQNQQLQGTELIFAKSELQPRVHPRTEAGDSWIERTIDAPQLQCF